MIVRLYVLLSMAVLAGCGSSGSTGPLFQNAATGAQYTSNVQAQTTTNNALLNTVFVGPATRSVTLQQTSDNDVIKVIYDGEFFDLNREGEIFVLRGATSLALTILEQTPDAMLGELKVIPDSGVPKTYEIAAFAAGDFTSASAIDDLAVQFAVATYNGTSRFTGSTSAGVSYEGTGTANLQADFNGGIVDGILQADLNGGTGTQNLTATFFGLPISGSGYSGAPVVTSGLVSNVTNANAGGTFFGDQAQSTGGSLLVEGDMADGSQIVLQGGFLGKQ